MRTLIRLRWGVRAVLTLGVAASVTANVLHAEPHLISQAIAAWPPVALLLTVELISRVPVHHRGLAVVRIIATAAIAGIAAWVSYWHMAGVAARYGETDASPYLLPLSVDGLIVVASVCLVELAGRIAVLGVERESSVDGVEPAPAYQPTNEEDAAMYAAWQRAVADGREPSGAELARSVGRPDDTSGVGRRAARRYRQTNGYHPLERRLAPDRGSTTVEMVGYTAVMLAAVLVGVQAAAWGLGELACRYAANHALQVTRVQGGTAAAGQADASTVLGNVSGDLVTGPQITATRGAATANVTVTGHAIQVIPFPALPVGATVSGPVEALGTP